MLPHPLGVLTIIAIIAVKRSALAESMCGLGLNEVVASIGISVYPMWTMPIRAWSMRWSRQPLSMSGLTVWVGIN